MKIKITPQQANALLAARKLTATARKATKRAIFAEIRADHPGIPRSVRFRVKVENKYDPLWCCLKSRTNDKPLDDGQPDAPPVIETPAHTPNTPLVDLLEQAPAEAPKKKVAAKTAKPLAKAPAKAPAKTHSTPKASPAKAVKAIPAKTLAKPAKAVPVKAVKAAAKPPAKAVKAAAKPASKAVYPKAVRVSANGTRVRLGTATSAAHEAQLLANHKAFVTH